MRNLFKFLVLTLGLVRVDGDYDVVCGDGTFEIVSAEDISHNNICPSTKGGVPSCIQSVVKVADGTFEAICKDGSHQSGTADQIVAGEICKCGTTPSPTPEPTPVPIPSTTVDILFVVDDSASMEPFQKPLAQNVDAFVNNLGPLNKADWHIGVLTTTAENKYPNSGHLRGSPVYLTQNTANVKSLLSLNLQPGTAGSGDERPFYSILLALSEPRSSTYNAGFLRTNAHLAVVFVTDADDQSNFPGSALLTFLQDLKKGTSAKILTYAAINDTNSTCQRNEDPPIRIVDFLTVTKGKKFDLCADDWGKKLEEIAKDIVAPFRRR
jgi:hypothetical protein